MTTPTSTSTSKPTSSSSSTSTAASLSSRYKPYPRYKDSGVEWLGEIPEEWEVKRLKALLLRNDGGVWGVDPTDGGTIVLRSTDMTVDGKWRIEDPAPRLLTDRERADGVLSEGDLVVTKSSGSQLHLGKTALVTETVAARECCFSNFMQRLRLRSANEPRFGRYVLNSLPGREQLLFYGSTTTGLANLTGRIIGNIAVGTPSPEEQRAIAEFLDRETAKIDNLIAQKERLIGLLEEKRAALITHAVTKGLPAEAAAKVGLNPDAPLCDSGIEWLGQIPAHWQVRRLRHVTSSIKNGTTATQLEFGETQYRVTRIETISTGVIDDTKVGFVDKTPDLEEYRLRPGDVLLSHINSLEMVGNCALYEGGVPLYGGMNLLRLRPNRISTGEWLLRWIQTIFARHYLRSVAKHAINQVSIPISTVKALPIVIPPSDERIAICDFVRAAETRTAEIRSNIARAIDHLKEYRAALITAAVTGKIDVRDQGKAAA